MPDKPTHPDRCLPLCMMPDGGEACTGYVAAIDLYREASAKVDRAHDMLNHYHVVVANLCSNLVTARTERDAYRRRVRYLEFELRRIAIINNGPDLASGEWRCGEAAAIAKAALTDSSPAGDRYRHLKRGTTYEVLSDKVRVQTSTPLTDNDTVVVYRAEADGSHWVRPRSEFFDGRFAKIEP